MKKMMLLAVMVALAALMMAAAPAFAAHKPGHQQPPPCFRFENHPPPNPKHCITPDGVIVPVDEVFDRDFFRDRDGDGFFDFDEPFITQDIEQEAESGDINQSFDVSQTGDNSNQTVGIQGTANTGNAQNLTNVVDAGPFVGDFDGDNVFVDDNDGLICFVDENDDGIDDENGVRCFDDGRFDDGLVFCDEDGDGEADGEADANGDCVVFFPDFNDDVVVVDDNDGDFNIFGNDGDIEFEDVGADITLSPTNTVDSSQQVNQAAAASAPQWVLTPWGWMQA
jgi:hypothetical protein